jgi:hypothetical protein
MAQAKNRAEYDRMSFENMIIEGFGLDVTQSVACPFCAAANFMKFKVLEVEEAMQRSHMCGECGRSAKAIVKRDANGVAFEIVQCGGPDQPEWLEPKMRRV